jgi:hypothetical protein
MKLSLCPQDLVEDGGLEISVSGFKGDPGWQPSQIFVEYYAADGGAKKLRIHVWDGTSEDPVTFEPEAVVLKPSVTELEQAQ